MIAALQDITSSQHLLKGDARSEVALKRLVTLEEFEEIAATLWEEKIELLHGELELSVPPDRFHMEKRDLLLAFFAMHFAETKAINCQFSQIAWFALPIETRALWTCEEVCGSSYVCPDMSIVFRDYLQTNRRPPALLVVEVISVSSQREIDRDLIRKPDIYATLEIPTYWVVDQRDNSVWVHTQPRDGHYTKREQCKGRRKLPAPGLEFLHITPAKIFEA